MRPTDVARTLRALIPTKVPIFLWGPPGVGKSALVKQAAADYGEFWDLRLAYHDPSDLKFPVVQDGQLRWVCSLLPKDPKWVGVICLEELAQSPPLMQAVTMQLTHDRRVGDYYLPENAVVVACSNRQEDRAGANRVITPVLNRFLHIDLEVSHDDWLAWAIHHVRSPLVAFLTWKPSLLHDFQPGAGQRAFPTPRSWERVSHVLDATPRELLHPVVSGCVGDGPAAEFVGFMRVYEQLPDINEVLANPKTATVPSRAVDVLHALCAALTERCREADMPLLGSLISYLMRLPDEFAILCGRNTMALNRDFVRAPGASDYLRKHKAMLVQANAA